MILQYLFYLLINCLIAKFYFDFINKRITSNNIDFDNILWRFLYKNWNLNLFKFIIFIFLIVFGGWLLFIYILYKIFETDDEYDD